MASTSQRLAHTIRAARHGAEFCITPEAAISIWAGKGGQTGQAVGSEPFHDDDGDLSIQGLH
jgi:hypothetical protein